MPRPLAVLLSVVALLGAVAVNGCSEDARHRVLSTLFEGVPKPGEERRIKPSVRSPRRVPPTKPEPEPAIVEASLPPPEPVRPAALRTWRDILQQFPKDAAGGVDWVRALEEKVIEPKAGLDPEAQDQPVFPLDVELTPEGQPLFKVTFPHQAHTRWLACTNCHPGVFQMQRGADPITMAKIYAGEYCGRCHGKVSFAVPTGCPRCHLALAGPKTAAAPAPVAPAAPAAAPLVEKLRTWDEVAKALPTTAIGGVDWVRAIANGLVAPRSALDPKAPGLPPLTLDVERIPKDQPTFRVVFPHSAHTQWLACANCHPGIFQMKRGATPINMGAIFAGQYCGVCHGKVAFAVPTGCPRCHPALAGAK
jgi:c(7)-type cytochrome triheme protein